MTEPDNAAAFAEMPAPLLILVAQTLKDLGYEHSIADMRLACRAWRAAIPSDGHFGALNLWDWADAPQDVLAVTLSKPFLALQAGPLAPAAAGGRLRSLALRAVSRHLLPGLEPLSGALEALDVGMVDGGGLPLPESPAAPSWLCWAAPLTGLTSLTIRSLDHATYPEAELSCLRPLKRLRRLGVRDAALFTDAAVPLLAALPALSAVDLTPSRLTAQAITALRRGLPRLEHLEANFGSSGALAAALRQGAPLAGLAVHLCMSRDDSHAFYIQGDALGGLPPSLRSFSFKESGLRVCLPPGASLGLLPPLGAPFSLHTLSLDNVELATEAAAAVGAAGGALRSLSLRLGGTARDDAIATWAALTGLTHLKLHGTWYLSEGAVAAALGAMASLRCLELAWLQGDAADMLAAPLAGMTDLRTLDLSSFRLVNAASLGAALSGAAPSLAALRLRWMGSCDGVEAAVAAAAAAMPRLKELSLWIHKPLSIQACSALSAALAQATSLTALDVGSTLLPHRGYLFGFGPAPLPVTPAAGAALVWASVAVLPRLRSLTVTPNTGWDAASIGALREASLLEEVAIYDGERQGVVTAEWVAAVARLPRLTVLSLHACKALGPETLAALREATALTRLTVEGCPEVARDAAALAALRLALPGLVKCYVRP